MVVVVLVVFIEKAVHDNQMEIFIRLPTRVGQLGRKAEGLIQRNDFTSLHFTLLSLKRICILQLMITSKLYGMVSTKCK